MPELDRFYREAADKAAILGVVEGSQEGRTRDWVMSGPYTLPILLDEGDTLYSAYKAWPFPALFVIDSMGNIVKRVAGPSDFDRLNQLVDNLKSG